MIKDLDEWLDPPDNEPSNLEFDKGVLDLGLSNLIFGFEGVQSLLENDIPILEFVKGVLRGSGYVYKRPFISDFNMRVKRGSGSSRKESLILSFDGRV